MYIRNVISYRGAWDLLATKYSQEFSDLSEVVDAISDKNIMLVSHEYITEEFIHASKLNALIDSMWCECLERLGWDVFEDVDYDSICRSLFFDSKYYTKNNILVSLLEDNYSAVRWLYSFVLNKNINNSLDVPVAAFFEISTSKYIYGGVADVRPSFEKIFDEIKLASPLVHSSPFIVLGISRYEGSIRIVNLETVNDDKNVIINRVIEFPPEYRQAGIGILSYFGTVLKEKYPEENAKVKIEQDGNLVRMIIESETGDKEVVEKALQEYELVVRGEAPPESLFDSKLQILELKSELRIANARIESQRELLALKDEVRSVKQLIGHSLTGGSAASPTTINFSPVINVSSNQSSHQEINNYFPQLLQDVQALKGMAHSDPAIEARLHDVEQALTEVGSQTDKDQLQSSAAMSRLKSFLDDANDAGSSVGKFVKTVGDGVGCVQELAKKYNKVACWCGAPTVPEVLL
ncbi:MAG: hypothetical protein OET90_09195 [Desulfuromonadales bacterium]|nr:hypothetical protein [Desulfuromonadales bacterium]